MKKQAIGTLLSLLLMASAAFAQDGSPPAGPHAGRSKRARRFVVPLILSAGAAQFTFDTTIFMTYTPGLAGLGAGPGASVDLFLFDDTAGSPLRSAAGQDVCNPCTFPLGGAGGRQSVRVDELLAAGGSFDAAVKLGFAVLVVGGADPDGVNIQGRVVSSRAGSSDLSVLTFEPQPAAAEAQ
ncbi:MAG TPA: hypothetical protein VG148_10315 [Pyrinomonadaceae bacterium]|nr:hypothetical protein [Pyrinomonadaceae bacterium]